MICGKKQHRHGNRGVTHPVEAHWREERRLHRIIARDRRGRLDPQVADIGAERGEIARDRAQRVAGGTDSYNFV